MKRGEIWWADLPKPVGRRPVLLLSRDAAYRVRTRVTIAPVTRTRRAIPSEVRLGARDGMPEDCIVNLDDIQTISKSYLSEHLTTLTREKLHEVRNAIDFSLDL